jgi:general secretion pathway protein G
METPPRASTKPSPTRYVLLALLIAAPALLYIALPREHARATSMVTQLASFKTALDAFQVDCGRLPTTEKGLQALLTNPPDHPVAGWHGPYLDSLPKDKWGHEYVYTCPGTVVTNADGTLATNRFDIYSLGPDGISHTGGDDPDDFAPWHYRVLDLYGWPPKD